MNVEHESPMCSYCYTPFAVVADEDPEWDGPVAGENSLTAEGYLYCHGDCDDAHANELGEWLTRRLVTDAEWALFLAAAGGGA